MAILQSIRTKLQLSFVLLALAAIGVTGSIVSAGATAALREATYDRLTAIRETKRHALERYFADMGRHVLALSTSETAVQALVEFQAAWPELGDREAGSPEVARALERFYEVDMGPRLAPRLTAADLAATWLPRDPRTRLLQYHAIVSNPHPSNSKDLLIDIDVPGRYGAVHARHHPTFHRYQSGFGFYDIFLISAPEGRVVYTVMKEVDLGATLTTAPYDETALGRVYRRVMERNVARDTEAVAFQDFQPYLPSMLAPAAFVAAPVRLAGNTIGALAMQMSIEEVDRVMTGEGRWREEGLGDTGEAFAVGADGTLRSDLRQQIEAPDAFIESLRGAQVSEDTIDRIQRDRTPILNLPMALSMTERVREGPAGTELGINLRGAPVLRSQVDLDVPDLGWVLVAEIDAAEALAPVRALQTRILTLGGVVLTLFFIVAGWLGASVTNPVLELARTVARVGEGQRGATVPVRSDDELGALAQAFNRMSADLERTTVSKSELEVLAGRLITAQEDERRRVGRELHDDVVQRLAATAIEVGRLERVGSLDDARAGLAQLKGAVVTLSKDVHQLSRQIHPAVLDEVGLAAAVERECRAFMERGGPPVDLRVVGTLDGLPKGAQLAVYRITQEGLRNVWQHADASEVSLQLQRDDLGVAIDLSDNGRGFDRADMRGPAGLGLASMEERARLLGGRLTVTSTPGGGTRVHALIPTAEADEASAHPAG